MDETLRTKLIEKQRHLHNTDQVFASLIGVSRSYWTLVRNGKAPLTLVIIGHSLNHWPELQNDVLFFLTSSVSKHA